MSDSKTLWEREVRVRVLCALGTPTEEDLETIRRVLDERKEGAR